jgi:hypothetical protein
VRIAMLAIAAAVLGATEAAAQATPACRLLCSPSFKVEPTLTVTNVFGRPSVVREPEAPQRVAREREFELILSVGLPTRLSWLEFTVEAIFLPFHQDGTPELEFEANLIWLPAARTRGWVSSHLDIVDKLSPAARPTDIPAYTHKLYFELDTSVAVFAWVKDGRWLRDVELEGSLDYVVTGLPRAGDVIDGWRFLKKASPWSFSLVLVIPVAKP